MKIEVQIDAVVAELRSQRDYFADKSADYAIKIAILNNEKLLLEKYIKDLEEKVKVNGGNK
jgi:uncharacterized protein YeeX (DUF496 family)